MMMYLLQIFTNYIYKYVQDILNLFHSTNLTNRKIGNENKNYKGSNGRGTIRILDHMIYILLMFNYLIGT